VSSTSSHAYELRRAVLREKVENEKVSVAEVTALRRSVAKLTTRVAELERHQRVLNPDAFEMLCRRVERLETTHLELGLHNFSAVAGDHGHFTSYADRSVPPYDRVPVRLSPHRHRGASVRAESRPFPFYSSSDAPNLSPADVTTTADDPATSAFSIWVEELVDRANLALHAAREQATFAILYAFGALQLQQRRTASPFASGATTRPATTGMAPVGAAAAGSREAALSPLSASSGDLDVDAYAPPSLQESPVRHLVTAGSSASASFADGGILRDLTPDDRTERPGAYAFEPPTGRPESSARAGASLQPSDVIRLCLQLVRDVVSTPPAGAGAADRAASSHHNYMGSSSGWRPPSPLKSADTRRGGGALWKFVSDEDLRAIQAVRNIWSESVARVVTTELAAVEQPTSREMDDETTRPSDLLDAMERGAESGGWQVSRQLALLRHLTKLYSTACQGNWREDLSVMARMISSRQRSFPPTIVDGTLARFARDALGASASTVLNWIAGEPTAKTQLQTAVHIGVIAAATCLSSSVTEEPASTAPVESLAPASVPVFHQRVVPFPSQPDDSYARSSIPSVIREEARTAGRRASLVGDAISAVSLSERYRELVAAAEAVAVDEDDAAKNVAAISRLRFGTARGMRPPPPPPPPPQAAVDKRALQARSTPQRRPRSVTPPPGSSSFRSPQRTDHLNDTRAVHHDAGSFEGPSDGSGVPSNPFRVPFYYTKSPAARLSDEVRHLASGDGTRSHLSPTRRYAMEPANISLSARENSQIRQSAPVTPHTSIARSTQRSRGNQQLLASARASGMTRHHQPDWR
jgi:hypothetical protein